MAGMFEAEEQALCVDEPVLLPRLLPPRFNFDLGCGCDLRVCGGDVRRRANAVGGAAERNATLSNPEPP